MSNYRYYLTNQLGTVETVPLGSSDFTINWNRQLDGSLRMYNKNFEGNVKFKGAAYQQLLKIEQSVDRCENQYLVIEKQCSINVWDPIFSGNISLNNGDWDLDNCSVVLKFTEENEASCFSDNDGFEINILQGLVKYTVNSRRSNISVETVSYSNTENITGGFYPDIPVIYPYWGGSGTPESGQWVWVEQYQSTQQQTENPITWTRQTNTTWAREVMLLDIGDVNTDDSWAYIGVESGKDKYVRPVGTYNYVMTNEITGNSNVIRAYYDYIGKSGTTISFRNGVRLVDVINKFIDELCPGVTIKSNFFQINPDVVSDINYVTGLPSKVLNLLLYSASDIKRPNATSSATTVNFDWERLVNALKKMFNVDWRVVDNELILEHVSYFQRNDGIDATVPYLSKFVKRQYTYQNESLPYKEEWVWASKQTGGGDFKGLPIIYNTNCVVNKKNTVTNTIEDIVTDIMLALQNPDSDASIVDDESIFFIAAGSDGSNFYVLDEPGIFGGRSLNNTLALAQLMRDYHRHERPFSRGLLNNQETQFLSVLPSKKGADFSIPYCCPNDFNPDDIIKTSLGNGIVDSAVFNFKKSTLELSLLYDSYENLNPVFTPVAVFDNVNTFDQDTIEIDVLENDTYRPGDEVQIVESPALGTAFVTPDNKISFFVNIGGGGSTRLSYRIFNSEWGTYSETVSVNINILAENQPPVANPDSYSALTDTQLVVNVDQGVLANDTDDYGGLFIASYDAVTDQGGSVIMQPNGSFTYNPPVGYSGSDSFSYVVEDNGGLTATGNVSILVQIQNLPITVDDVYQVQISKSLNVDGTQFKPGILNNDYTLDSSPFSALAENKTTSLGSINIASSGLFYYTALSVPGKDQTQYTAVGTGGNSQGNITINVLPVIKVGVRLINSVTTLEPRPCGNTTVDAITVTRADVEIYFLDSNNNPIDVTGLDLVVTIKGTFTNLMNNASTESVTRHECSGLTTIAGNSVITLYRDNGCTGTIVSHYTNTFEVNLMDGYNLI